MGGKGTVGNGSDHLTQHLGADVAYGKDADAAKKVLEDKGYTPVEGNLNDGGKTYAMMGYKTTDDIRDSITDLAVMNMRGDYSVEEYKTAERAKDRDRGIPHRVHGCHQGIPRQPQSR